MRMFDSDLEEKMLQHLFDREGLHGVLHIAEERDQDGRIFDAASALLFATRHAHIVIQGTHNILIDKRDGEYTIHLWIAEYRGWVTFGFQASGYGYRHGMKLTVVAKCCLDAIDALENMDWIDVNAGQADEMIAFQAVLKEKKSAMQRLFEAMVTHS